MAVKEPRAKVKAQKKPALSKMVVTQDGKLKQTAPNKAKAAKPAGSLLVDRPGFTIPSSKPKVEKAIPAREQFVTRFSAQIQTQLADAEASGDARRVMELKAAQAQLFKLEDNLNDKAKFNSWSKDIQQTFNVPYKKPVVEKKEKPVKDASNPAPDAQLSQKAAVESESQKNQATTPASPVANQRPDVDKVNVGRFHQSVEINDADERRFKRRSDIGVFFKDNLSSVTDKATGIKQVARNSSSFGQKWGSTYEQDALGNRTKTSDYQVKNIAGGAYTKDTRNQYVDGNHYQQEKTKVNIGFGTFRNEDAKRMENGKVVAEYGKTSALYGMGRHEFVDTENVKATKGRANFVGLNLYESKDVKATFETGKFHAARNSHVMGAYTNETQEIELTNGQKYTQKQTNFLGYKTTTTIGPDGQEVKESSFLGFGRKQDNETKRKFAALHGEFANNIAMTKGVYTQFGQNMDLANPTPPPLAVVPALAQKSRMTSTV